MGSEMLLAQQILHIDNYCR